MRSTITTTIAPPIAMPDHASCFVEYAFQPSQADGDVDAVDHRDAEARQDRGDRQDEGVGIPRPQPQHDVEGEDERGEPAAVVEEGHVDRAERRPAARGRCSTR